MPGWRRRVLNDWKRSYWQCDRLCDNESPDKGLLRWEDGGADPPSAGHLPGLPALLPRLLGGPVLPEPQGTPGGKEGPLCHQSSGWRGQARCSAASAGVDCQYQVMFFGPTILGLARRCEVFLLCMSPGTSVKNAVAYRQRMRLPIGKECGCL